MSCPVLHFLCLRLKTGDGPRTLRRELEIILTLRGSAEPNPAPSKREQKVSKYFRDLKRLSHYHVSYYPRLVWVTVRGPRALPGQPHLRLTAYSDGNTGLRELRVRRAIERFGFPVKLGLTWVLLAKLGHWRAILVFVLYFWYFFVLLTGLSYRSRAIRCRQA